MMKKRGAELDRNEIPNSRSTDVWMRPEIKKTRKTWVYVEVIVPFLRRKIKVERSEAIGSSAPRMSLCQYSLGLVSYLVSISTLPWKNLPRIERNTYPQNPRKVEAPLKLPNKGGHAAGGYIPLPTLTSASKL
jgi:hypothetical protein